MKQKSSLTVQDSYSEEQRNIDAVGEIRDSRTTLMKSQVEEVTEKGQVGEWSGWSTL